MDECVAMFSVCRCRHRATSPGAVDGQDVVVQADEPLVRPASAGKVPPQATPDANGLTAPKPSAEDRVCPMTGAIGYCPMARPKGGRLPGEKLPELKVMFLLLWEDGRSKVSVGVYPHMNKHWAALELPDTSKQGDIKTQFRKLSIKYHPDKNQQEGAKERFQEISEAYEALRGTDGELSFPWDQHTDRQHVLTGIEALRTFGPLASEAAGTDPIKAQMMQHVVKEATDCKALMFTKDSVSEGMKITETWADALCVDTRNGSNHLVKVYRRIATPTEEAAAAQAAEMDALEEDESESTRAPDE